MDIRVERSIAGPVLIRFGTILNGFACALTDGDAIKLCDSIRRVVEEPTTREPNGPNVIVMKVAE
jgi:hypothetical protein